MWSYLETSIAGAVGVFATLASVRCVVIRMKLDVGRTFAVAVSALALRQLVPPRSVAKSRSDLQRRFFPFCIVGH